MNASQRESRLCFVQQTGTKEDDKAARKLIRRRVMLGKNRGRTRGSEQKAAHAAIVVRAGTRHPPADATLPSVPQKVGSDLSFMDFADEVELSLIGNTLRFCVAAKSNLFVLEPCISFDPKDTTWLQPLTSDALYLNVMVYAAQAYMDRSSLRAPSQSTGSRKSPTSQHYSKALHLLRSRLIDADIDRSSIADTTMMAVFTLAMHALLTGELEAARNHATGFSRLMTMRGDGVYAFRRKTKLMIELLRCDISVSISTGEVPLLFADKSLEPLFPLPFPHPTSSSNEELCRHNVFADNTLSVTWIAMKRFCSVINEASAARRRLPEDIFLETMASVMYRLLQMDTGSNTVEETFRFALLAFSASVFLPWRYVRLPSGWLEETYKSALDGVLKLETSTLDPTLQLWLVTIFGVTFPPANMEGEKWLRFWVMRTVEACGVRDWDEMKKLLGSILWIDFVFDGPVKELFDEATLWPDKASSKI